MSPERIINVDGYNVSVCNFGYASYFYPTFNHNAEFKVCSNGFKRLRHYLRLVTWAQKSLKEAFAQQN